MTIGYFDDAGDIYAEGLNCPECGSISTLRNVEFGDWKCENCSTIWNESDQADDSEPDYEVDTPDLCERCGGTGWTGAIHCYLCGGSGYVVEGSQH